MNTLIEYAEKYKHLYTIPNHGVFHTAVGTIVGQRVSFQTGRNIRKQLYDLCGFPLKRKAVLDADLTKIKGIRKQHIELIKTIATIETDNRNENIVLNDYTNIPGFGIWTINSVKIITSQSESINLYTDFYIRRVASLYVGKSMKPSELKNFIEEAPNNKRTAVCYFLWRIKKDNIHKLKEDVELTSDDFL